MIYACVDSGGMIMCLLCSVSPYLTAVIGITEGSLGEIMVLLRRHFHETNAIDHVNMLINLSTKMRRVIRGWSSIDFASIPTCLINSGNIKPKDKVTLEFNIKYVFMHVYTNILRLKYFFFLDSTYWW